MKRTWVQDTCSPTACGRKGRDDKHQRLGGAMKIKMFYNHQIKRLSVPHLQVMQLLASPSDSSI
jgi:hypothetical protein